MTHDYQVPRPGPLLVLWRWRIELAVLGWWILFAGVVGPQWAALAGLATFTAVLTVKPLRTPLAGRLWALVMAHRFRVACREARLCSRNGKIPIIVTTRATPWGVRLQLWCRAGTAAVDVLDAAPMIRDTCWAADVAVYEHTHYRHLVLVDVIRHQFGEWPAAPRDSVTTGTTSRFDARWQDEQPAEEGSADAEGESAQTDTGAAA